MRERGLKFYKDWFFISGGVNILNDLKVAPVRERGLKSAQNILVVAVLLSLP